MNICTEKQSTLLRALASIGDKAQLTKLGVTNGRVASRRTISFDIPDHPIAGTEPTATANRIKLTAHSDGTVDVRLLEVAAFTKVGDIVPVSNGLAEQHKSFDRVPTAEVGELLKAQINLGL